MSCNKQINNLANSIVEYGLINPISICNASKDSNGKFQIVSGHRRVMAATQLGHSEIRATNLDTNETAMVAISDLVV